MIGFDVLRISYGAVFPGGNDRIRIVELLKKAFGMRDPRGRGKSKTKGQDEHKNKKTPQNYIGGTD